MNTSIFGLLLRECEESNEYEITIKFKKDDDWYSFNMDKNSNNHLPPLTHLEPSSSAAPPPLHIVQPRTESTFDHFFGSSSDDENESHHRGQKRHRDQEPEEPQEESDDDDEEDVEPRRSFFGNNASSTREDPSFYGRKPPKSHNKRQRRPQAPVQLHPNTPSAADTALYDLFCKSVSFTINDAKAIGFETIDNVHEIDTFLCDRENHIRKSNGAFFNASLNRFFYARFVKTSMFPTHEKILANASILIFCSICGNDGCWYAIHIDERGIIRSPNSPFKSIFITNYGNYEYVGFQLHKKPERYISITNCRCGKYTSQNYKSTSLHKSRLSIGMFIVNTTKNPQGQPILYRAFTTLYSYK